MFACIFGFLSEFSDKPYYKAGVKEKGEDSWKREPEGKFVCCTALVIDTSAEIVGVLCNIIEVCCVGVEVFFP